MQIILRKFLEFITLFKNLVDLLSLNNQNQLSKYFDSYILREIYSLCYFIKKFFKLKYCLIFFCVKIQSILINFDLIFDKWLEKIEKFIIIYENINKIGYYISFKKLQYFFNRNKNLIPGEVIAAIINGFWKKKSFLRDQALMDSSFYSFKPIGLQNGYFRK